MRSQGLQHSESVPSLSEQQEFWRQPGVPHEAGESLWAPEGRVDEPQPKSPHSSVFNWQIHVPWHGGGFGYQRRCKNAQMWSLFVSPPSQGSLLPPSTGLG